MVYIDDICLQNCRRQRQATSLYCTCLGHLRRSDIIKNNPICVASPKVANASAIGVAVAGIIAGVIALTFANGNTA